MTATVPAHLAQSPPLQQQLTMAVIILIRMVAVAVVLRQPPATCTYKTMRINRSITCSAALHCWNSTGCGEILLQGGEIVCRLWHSPNQLCWPPPLVALPYMMSPYLTTMISTNDTSASPYSSTTAPPSLFSFTRFPCPGISGGRYYTGALWC